MGQAPYLPGAVAGREVCASVRQRWREGIGATSIARGADRAGQLHRLRGGCRGHQRRGADELIEYEDSVNGQSSPGKTTSVGRNARQARHLTRHDDPMTDHSGQ